MKALFTLLLALAVWMMPLSINAAEDDSEVRSAVTSFCEALKSRDLKALKISTDWNWDEKLTSIWTGLFSDGEYVKYPITGIEVKWVKVVGDTATVRVFWNRIDAASGADYKAFTSNHRVIKLSRNPTGWRVSNLDTAENDLITRLLRSDSFEDRKQMIRVETELNTHRVIFVILFRLRNDGKYDLTDEFHQLAEWYNDEYFKGRNEKDFVNTNLNILNSKAATQVALGDIEGAVRTFLELTRTADEYQRRTGELVGGAALGTVNLGSLYFRQGNLAQAEYFANLTLKMLEKADRVKQNVLFASVYGLLGDIALRRGQNAKAAEYFKGAGEDGDLRRATALLAQGDDPEAVKLLERIIEAAENESLKKLPANLPRVIEVSARLSDVYLRIGSIPDAVQSSLRAVRFADQLKNPEYRYAALASLGRVRIATGELDAAERAFRDAVEVIEAERTQIIGNTTDRLFFFDNRTEPFQRLVEIAVRRGQVGKAFEISELGRARSLREIVKSGWFDWREALSGADREREASFRRKRYDLNRRQTLLKLDPGSDPVEIESTNRAIEMARNEYEFLRSTAYARNPSVRRSAGISNQISESQLLSLLKRHDEAFISFFKTPDQTYLFVARLKKGQPKVDVLTLDASPKEISASVREMRERIANRDLDFKPIAKRLHNTLFSKAAPFLTGVTKLTIVPDGDLWDVPFAALIDGNDRFLIETTSINLAQSLTALAELELTANNRAQIDGVLAFGNPRINPDSLLSISAERRSSYGNLPEAELEVNALKSIFQRGSRIEIGTNAAEDVWKSEAGRYRVLHLATHGVTDPTEPLYSHLLLSTSGATGDDGLLEAWEIMELKLNADLVVLSACETGRGRVGAGEGMIGISWAFAVAGVPRVVSSQWMVNSASTSQLMIGFHRELRSRKSDSVAEALRRSMIQTSRDPKFKHPYYWSGFVSIGGR